MDDNQGCKAALLAQAKQIAIKGHVSKSGANGHWLGAPFEDIYEMKPGDYRFFGFRHGRIFYITNGAPKKTKGKQRVDYQEALKRRNEFLNDVNTTADRVRKP
jgi:hypothetical protein